MFKFIQQISVFSIIIIGVIAGLYNTVLKPWYLPVMPWTIAFVACVSVAFYFLLKKTDSTKPVQFGNRYIMLSTLKFFIYITFVVVYFFLNKSHAIPFAGFFLALYFAYTTFELIFILREVNKN